MQIPVNNWKIWVKDWGHSACFEHSREEPQEGWECVEGEEFQGSQPLVGGKLKTRVLGKFRPILKNLAKTLVHPEEF